MRKEFLVAAAVVGLAVAVILIYAMVRTVGEQRDTQRQLDELKKQMLANQSIPPATAPGPVLPGAPATGPAIIIGATTQDGSALAREKAIHEVLAEGFRLLNTRDPQSAARAAQIFREGIDKVDNKNLYFYNGLGRSLLVSGKYDDALKAFQDGHAVDLNNTEIISGTGWAYWNLKDYYHAKQQWEQAIAKDPKSVDSWMVMSWVYLALNDVEKSKEGFITLLKVDSGRIDWINGLTMARAGNHDLAAIRSQFKGMPDPSLFLSPPASASAPATAH